MNISKIYNILTPEKLDMDKLNPKADNDEDESLMSLQQKEFDQEYTNVIKK